MFAWYKKHPLELRWGLATVLVCQLLLFYLVVMPVRTLAKTSEQVMEHVTWAKDSLNSQNVDDLADAVGVLNSDVLRLEKDLQRFDYLRFFPVVTYYYADAQSLISASKPLIAATHTLVEDFKPFASVAGFGTGNEEVDTADQKLQQLVKVAPNLTPAIEGMVEAIDEALPHISELHWELYPNTANLPLRDRLKEVTTAATSVKDIVEDLKPLIVNFPSILGEPQPKNYLILLQNDKELRPTGGFITSYALLTARNGSISISDAKNIYEVSTSEGFITPPVPIKQHLKVTGWHMRDTNFSPDFKSSMETFDYYWQTLRLPKVDGYIAVDTQFVAALLTHLGPIEVAGYTTDFSLFPGVPESCKVGGSTFTGENVVCRLEFYAQRLTNDQGERKDVIGKLMDEMYSKLMTAPSDQWYPLMQTITTQFGQKHILAYMKDPAFQLVVEDLSWGGRIVETEGDYLHVNDANLAGLKSDMYLKRSVDQVYEVIDGRVKKTLTLTYENTGAFDGWLNATARNYLRVYVPLGSELVDIIGADIKGGVSEDLGKTVFDSFVLIPPLSSKSVTIAYYLPNVFIEEPFSVLIQKQPGIETTMHTIKDAKGSQTIDLRKDASAEISL